MKLHEELKDICLTSVQLNHSPMSAPNTDNIKPGCPSVAIGLGDYCGGRLRIVGAKQPLHTRNHAVVFDGLQTHFRGRSTLTAGR
jgi:hypothetical protein